MNTMGALATPISDGERALALVARTVALAPASEQIHALRDAAIHLGQFVAEGWINPATAADRIIEVAELHGLSGEPGSDEAEAIEKIAQLASVVPLFGPAPGQPPADDWRGPTEIPESADAKPVRRAAPPPIVPVALITPGQWPNEAPPPVDWLADHRIPRGDVTTLHGDGGAGKTDIALQLAEGCARGAGYWLGHAITIGPVVILSAEEPDREVRRRIWLHGQRDGFTLGELDNLHLWFPDDVAGAVFAMPGQGGIMQPTPLFRSIERAIADIAPVLVTVDNVAATYTGNQNDRVMVRSYVNLWRSIARQASHPAVLLLDHPSLSGLTAGTGRGGNMDWRNAVRCALYLKNPDDKEETDRGIRILETVKTNYGPIGEPVRLQWAEGGLARERPAGSFQRLAEDAKVDDAFLQLLDKRNAQGRPVRPSTGHGYAPAEFEADSDAAGIKAPAFKASMERLLTAGRIKVVTVGPPSRQSKHIERATP